MQEIKRIGALSTAKICALFGIFIGIIAGALSQLSCYINAEIATQAGMQCTNLGIWGVLLMVVFAGVSYFLGGLIGAGLYNLFVQWVGGIKVDLGAGTGNKKK